MTDTRTHVVLDLLDGAGVGVWTLDESASSISIRHRALWGLATAHGSFTEIAGEGEILADGTAIGILRIAAASASTRSKRHEARLRSASFLAADEHSQIVFWLTNVRLGDQRDVHLDGELEVRGINRPISFPAMVTEATEEAITLTGEVLVDRNDFEITSKRALIGRTTVQFVARFTH